MEIFRNRSQQRNFNKSAANISSRSKREVFFGQILYSIHCVFAVVWIKITLREANTYLTVKTVAMTMMGRRRMESRMGKRTTEGEAGEVFITVRRSSTQCSISDPTFNLSFYHTSHWKHCIDSSSLSLPSLASRSIIASNAPPLPTPPFRPMIAGPPISGKAFPSWRLTRDRHLLKY